MSELHLSLSSPRFDLPPGAFLFCRECRVAHRVDDADRAPLYGVDGTSRVADDRQTFLRAHQDHAVGVLTRSSEREARSRPRWDPMMRTTFEATDGDSSWIVVAEREEVGGPRRHWVRPGRLAVAEESVTLDEGLLREAIDDALYPYAAPASLLDEVVARVRTLVERTHPDAYELVGEDRRDPTVDLAGLPPTIVGAFHDLVERSLPEGEARRLIDLAERELSAELPVVRIRRRYTVVPDGSGRSP